MKAKSYAELDSASSKNQNTIREEGYTYNANLCNQVLVHEGFMGKMFCYVNEIIRLIKVVNLREQVQIFWTFSLTFAFLIGLIMFHPLLHVGFPELLVTNGLF